MLLKSVFGGLSLQQGTVLSLVVDTSTKQPLPVLVWDYCGEQICRFVTLVKSLESEF